MLSARNVDIQCHGPCFRDCRYLLLWCCGVHIAIPTAGRLSEASKPNVPGSSPDMDILTASGLGCAGHGRVLHP